jgi:hypothetical protein
MGTGVLWYREIITIRAVRRLDFLGDGNEVRGRSPLFGKEIRDQLG